MYDKIQESLSNKLGEFAVSAILSSGNGFDVGNPCIADIGAAQLKKPFKRSDITNLFKEEKDIPKALNEFLLSSNAVVPVMYFFASRLDVPIGYIGMTHGFSLHCIKTTPILRDVYKRNVVKKIDNIVPSHNLAELPEKIAESLKKYRYVNHVVEDICKSKVNSILDNLSRMVAILSEKYTNNTCVYLHGSGQNTLIDTLSISFYRIQDVIPVFDYKRVAGVAVEMLFTNSTLNGDDILHNNGNYLIVRCIFSRYKDNLFTIDGERIKRQLECPVRDIISETIYKLLKTNTPDDTALKKAKSSREGE